MSWVAVQPIRVHLLGVRVRRQDHGFGRRADHVGMWGRDGTEVLPKLRRKGGGVMIDYHCELETLPDVIKVRLPDRRGGSRLQSARIWRYVPERPKAMPMENMHPSDGVVCQKCGAAFMVTALDVEDGYLMSDDEIECVPSYCPICGERMVYE